jgi:C-terminal processing protease CtpA/Prc
VFVPSFVGEFGSEFDLVLRSLAGARALVIDIRDNGGGNEANGDAIASRLTRETRTYQLTRYRNGPRHTDFTSELEKKLRPSGSRFDGPVALLTNRYNGSAAEDFVTMMRVIPTVFTVGDTTLGNASNPLHRELPNGWLMTIPQSVQMTPDRFVIEGLGLPPTFAVMQDTADTSAGTDTILAFALGELRRRLE